MEQVKINIFESIGGDGAISVDDGELIYTKMEKALDHDAILILDFNHIKLITTAFLNAAIGQMYGKYDASFIKDRLRLENVEKEDLSTFKKVTNRAKQYFADRKAFEESVNNQLGNG